MGRAVVVPDRNRPRVVDRRWVASLRRIVVRRGVALGLFGLVALSTALRIVLVARVHAPTVFSDELGYNKLALSIGQTGKLALFNEPGLSYSPLYPAVLAPIYALGASAPDAYEWIKVVNAFLISLSILPTFKIARFVLPRRPSLLVAAVSTIAPLMSYSYFTMSENLAYPVCLVAIWAMIAAIREPSARNDAILLGSIGVATAARVQLIVLVPAALTAVVLAGIFERQAEEGIFPLVAQGVRRHWLLFGSVVAVLAVAGVGALAGQGVFSAFGRYEVVGSAGHPNVGHFLNLLIRHVAGLDLAVGVAPFVGALVAAFVFARSRSRGKAVAFAAVAVSVTCWLLVEVAWDAAVFDSPSGDIPRIHERFLIYAVPFFLVAYLATVQFASTVSRRIYLGAAAVAALSPVVIPFDTVINGTISFESLGLEPFARVVRGETVPVPHATLTAVWIAATFALLYVVVHERMRSVVLLALIAFLLISGLAWTRIESAALFARSTLPAQRDWIDRTKSGDGVVLLTAGESSVPALETAYNNLSITRLYYICAPAFGPEFGEKAARIDPAGSLRDSAGYVRADYAIVPAGLVFRGRIVATNPEGEEVLIAPRNGVLTLPAGTPNVRCSPPIA